MGDMHPTWLVQAGGTGDTETHGATTVPPMMQEGADGPQGYMPRQEGGERCWDLKGRAFGIVEDHVERLDQQ